MARLSDMVVDYLRAQVEAGADVIQVFDSWVGSLGPAEYRQHVRPHMERIFGALTDVPTIHFGTATSGLLEELAAAGGDVIGLDHRVALDDGWRRIGAHRGVQGNLDSARLLAGWEATREGTDAVLAAAAGRAGHIFNLGHGVLPGSEPDLMRRIVDRVHERTALAVTGAVT
jgi:uroporphyrinogen decarboxylase